MIVVSDATPLNVLVRIERAELLRILYGRIIIPRAVHDELTHAHTPEFVQRWVASRPSWLEIHTAVPLSDVHLKGRGEREAIALAHHLKADLLLADDRAARATALRLGIATVGTLGVLELASARRLAPLPDSLQRIQTHAPDFFLSEKLIQSSLMRDAERRRGQSAR